MKQILAILATTLITGCTLLRGDTTTTRATLDTILVTHMDQQIALEGILGQPLDLNSDGNISIAEWDATLLSIAVLVASDNSKAQDLKDLIDTSRFKVWLGAVAGSLALGELEDKLSSE